MSFVQAFTFQAHAIGIEAEIVDPVFVTPPSWNSEKLAPVAVPIVLTGPKQVPDSHIAQVPSKRKCLHFRIDPPEIRRFRSGAAGAYRITEHSLGCISFFKCLIRSEEMRDDQTIEWRGRKEALGQGRQDRFDTSAERPIHRDAAVIARTLASKEVSPKGPASGMRMLTYFINRGGKGLSASRKQELERAKHLLSERIERKKRAA